MGFLDKVKNMFIEEYEDDEVKKEVIKVKIPTPEKKEEKIVHEYEPNHKYDEDYKGVKIEEEKEEVKEQPKSPIPTYFDDSDFDMLPKEEEKNIIKQEYKYTKTETIIKPSSTIYGVKKEEFKKNFTPTPIISPVYGILDKNYKKEEIKPKKTSTIYSQFDHIDVDDIRNKAYGTLEDEVESNLKDGNIIFNDDIDTKLEDDKEITDYEEQPIDIFKELEKKDALDDLMENYNDVDKDNLVSKELEDTSLIEDELNKNYDNYEMELEESNKTSLNDSDLFNLIDSMYNKEDGE